MNPRSETTTEIHMIDPVTGKMFGYMGSRQVIILKSDNVGVIKKDGRVVYRESGHWMYEPPGYAILSRNYPAMAPVEEA